jgi:hypothetical protein
MDIINKFIKCFPSICFEITEKRKTEPLSIETVSSGEREILRILHEAERNLARIKKLHHKGKASSEELMDHEYYVFELKEQLEKFREQNEDIDNNLEELSDE